MWHLRFWGNYNFCHEVVCLFLFYFQCLKIDNISPTISFFFFFFCNVAIPLIDSIFFYGLECMCVTWFFLTYEKSKIPMVSLKKKRRNKIKKWLAIMGWSKPPQRVWGWLDHLHLGQGGGRATPITPWGWFGVDQPPPNSCGYPQLDFFFFYFYFLFKAWDM
jgi:hypothetical protein